MNGFESVNATGDEERADRGERLIAGGENRGTEGGALTQTAGLHSE